MQASSRQTVGCRLVRVDAMGRVEQWYHGLMTYGMVPWLFTAVWFLQRVGDREKPLDWDYIKALFRAISPYYWASLGMYMSIGASITGAAWCAYLLRRPAP